MQMNIEFTEGQAPDDGWGGLDGEYILLGVSGELFAVGHVNSNGGTCDCCGAGIPEHVAYYKLPERVE